MKELWCFLLVPGVHPSGWPLLSKIDFILPQPLQLCLLQLGFLCSGTRYKHLKHRKFQPMVECPFFTGITVPCQRWTHSFLWWHTTLTNIKANQNKEGFVIYLAFIKFFQLQAGISGVKKGIGKKQSLPRTKTLVSEIFISGIARYSFWE